MAKKTGIACLFSVLGVALGACQADPGWSTAEGLDYTPFKEDVYPILIRDCAFQACHGAEERFFRVWGPGRVRLSATSSAYSNATSEEITQSYQRALAMVDSNDPGQSLLLRKPLATAAGGAGHLGADKFGRNLYRTVDDDGYLVLSRWVFAATKK
jgi:hypothetical protein